MLAVMTPPANAQSFLAWKGLTPGPYPVGFSTATVEDLTRTLQTPTDFFGRPRPGYGRRPVHIAIWQPADSGASGLEMTYGDYLPLLAWDTGPEAEGAAERAVAELQYIQTVTPQASPPDQASIDRLMGERVWARRDAKPAPGRFPVLIYAPGSGYPAFDNSVLFEYLASHGYVVVSAPSTGPDAGRMPYNAFGLEAQARDLEFLAGYVQTLPQADPERIGTAGFSWGGLSSVLFALRNARVKTVISLDGVLREEQSLAVARTFPHFRPQRLRVPMLVFTAAPDPAAPGSEDESFLEQARFAEITRAVVAGMVHHDFGSMSSLLRRSSRDGKTRDWTPATAGYEAVCKLTLEFLDAHLKGTGEAEPRPDGEVATVCAISTRQAQKAPPTPEDFLEVLERDGLSAATDLVRAAAKSHPDVVPSFEGAIIQAGYAFLGAGRIADAISVLALCVEILPESVNASDSLGEAYLAAGELTKAETCYLDAKSKLERMKGLSAETKAQYIASADRALAEIEKRRQKK
jgi:dienelactone hydrolase